MDPDCTCTICEIHGYASYIKANDRIHELEAELATASKQIQDAIPELPHVAGPLAHRIRFMRDQYDGWCKEYKAERDRYRKALETIPHMAGDVTKGFYDICKFAEEILRGE